MKSSMKSLWLGCVAALTLTAAVSAADSEEGFVKIFDGKTLTGWIAKGGTASYRVEDGMIIGKTVEGSKNTFLSTTRDYADFEFECDVKCDVALNSGFQIRSHTYDKPTPQASDPKKIREKGEVYGYQCEIAAAAKGVRVGGAPDTFLGAGNDFAIGGVGGDTVIGDSGDDWIQGGAGSDDFNGDAALAIIARDAGRSLTERNIGHGRQRR